MMSGGNWVRAKEIFCIRHHSRGSETRQSLRVNSPVGPLRPDDYFVRLLRVAKRRSGRAAAQKSPWPHRRRATENVRATRGTRYSVPQPRQTEMRTGSVGQEVHRAF